MTDKDFVLYFDTFANETMGRDLASGADDSILLDFYEGPDAAIVSDDTSININLLGMVIFTFLPRRTQSVIGIVAYLSDGT